MSKYRSCHSIEGELFFQHMNKVGYCCMGKQPTIFENYTGEIFDAEEFFKKREEHIELMKNGGELLECKNCVWIKEREWDERKKEFRYILINIWVKCNFKCIYCDTHSNKMLEDNTKPYDIVPVLKDLFEKGYITVNTKIDIAGGEAALDPGFDNLIDFLVSAGIKEININTNASVYSDKVERGIKEGKISLISSVDCGSRKKFEFIKKVPCYDKVWSHIKNYSSCLNKNNSNSVRTKYIVIPGVNDSKKEITDFILKSKKNGVSGVIFNVDINWINNNSSDKAGMYRIIKLAEFFIDTACNADIEWNIWAHIEDLISKYNSIEKDNPVDLAIIYDKNLYKDAQKPFKAFMLKLRSLFLG